jgi:NADPH:quinone reductase-like Zn-dependent oxidoreductase
VLGSDFAGTVAEVGPGVTEFADGDRVFGFRFGGMHAEYATVKADGAVLKTPDAERHGGGGATLRCARVAGVPRSVRRREAGRKGAVVGASGGVGAYAVQIARALGAEVTGVASGSRGTW